MGACAGSIGLARSRRDFLLGLGLDDGNLILRLLRALDRFGPIAIYECAIARSSVAADQLHYAR